MACLCSAASGFSATTLTKVVVVALITLYAMSHTAPGHENSLHYLFDARASSCHLDVLQFPLFCLFLQRRHVFYHATTQGNL
jgi:hypothetical protein